MVMLISEFGVDGAMIARAAEANSSVFRPEAQGGVAPWKEVVEEYLKISMDVENRWGNTKFLLGHLVPGKLPVFQQVTQCKSYQQVCKVLGLEHLESRAIETDEALNIVPLPEGPKQGKGRGKKNKSALAAGGNHGQARTVDGEKKKKALSERGSMASEQQIIEPQPGIAVQV
jgi:tRNA-dihydrouridine synthase 2